MPTYRPSLVFLTRLMGEATTMLMDKKERITFPYKDEPQTPRNDGIKLGQFERVKLMYVKQEIDKILEECKDDGL